MKKNMSVQLLVGTVLIGGLIACGGPTPPPPPPANVASLGGVVFDDLNKNGTREAGELGLKDWTVYVDTNGNGALDAGEKSVLTTDTGAYSLTDVPQGNVKLGVKMRLGYNAAQRVTLTSSQIQPQAAKGASSQLRPQIVNGTVVTNADTYPFQVAFVPKWNTTTAFCGGSLIAPRWVLSAAHCFFKFQVDPITADLTIIPSIAMADIRVRTGVLNLVADPPQGQVLEVSQISRHPDYDAGTNSNDIVLIKLSANVAATPIIPASATETNLNAPGTAVRVIGWGRTSNNGPLSNELREVANEIATEALCKASFTITDKMICAKTPTGDTIVRESCQGDSGGPLFTQNPLRQVGVVSFGLPSCDNINTPGVYARVTEYDAWLSTNTGRANTDGTLTINLTANTTNAGIGVRQSD